MICPHCETGIFSELGDKNFSKIALTSKEFELNYYVEYLRCPACYKFIIYLTRRYDVTLITQSEELIYPHTSPHPKCPVEVPSEIAQEYTEACLILPLSATASAALSRRCLQHFLEEVVKVKKDDLIREIQEVMKTGQLPSYISDQLDAVRNIGNFGAHPIKSKQTGTILPVEPGEAEWNIKILDALFDFYCVQPAIAKKRKDDLNQKLTEAGKPPLP